MIKAIANICFNSNNRTKFNKNRPNNQASLSKRLDSMDLIDLIRQRPSWNPLMKMTIKATEEMVVIILEFLKVY